MKILIAYIMAQSIDLSTMLLNRLKKRDPAAFEMVYNHYSAALFGIIFRTVGHRETAEEALTDAFLKIWNQIDTYDNSKGTLFTWMYRIARNQAIDARRSHHFKAGQKSVELDDYVSRLQGEAGREDYIGLDKVLAGLEELCRKLIGLNFFMGFSHAEISEKENMPLGSVKTKLRNCLQKVKIQMHECD
jgi:RNA polymerase sigma-70 factor, ECF subfamily